MKAATGSIFFVLVLSLLAIALSGCATANRTVKEKEKIPSAAARRHLDLARFYCSYKRPDYRKALKEFELYLSSSPAGAGTDEIKDWIAVLRRLNESRQRTSQLTKTNRQLKDSLDRLERLDLEMEQERKQVR
ncbi:MAG: hypothetical protein M0Z75_04295 [Nitrospiraceae bacterium]|nr:hypothetical protein [Nitrospiraceae bacterium]